MSHPGHQSFSITLASWARALLVIFFAYMLYKIAGVALVILTALVISAAIEPLLRFAKRYHIPRLPTVIALYAAAGSFLSVCFYFLFLPLVDEVKAFVNTLTVYSNSVGNDSVLSNMFANQHVFGGIQTPALMGELSNYLTSFSQFLSQGIFSTASLFFGGALGFVLIIVLSFYLAVQEDGMERFLRVIIPAKHEGYAVGLWKRSQIKIGFWMQGQLLLGLVVAVMVYIGLIIIGVPNALLFAVLAGLFELIPIFGPVISAIPAVFTAYTALGASDALIVAGLFLFIQQLENHIIYPMVVKKVVGVPPLVSIIALLIGAELAGFLGILISVPVAVTIMEYLNDLEEEKHVGLVKEA